MNNKLQAIVAVAVITATTAFPSRGQSGLFMSHNDFKTNSLAHQMACNNNRHNKNIHLHDFFGNMPTITVNDSGRKYTLKKNDVYGFRDCDKEVYRFFGNEVYHIVEAGDLYIYIYTQTQNIAQSKGFKVVNNYYFSNSGNGKILRLTKENIRSEFSSNQKFLDLLDQYFANEEIHTYDKDHKTFKVNYVYFKAIKG